MPRDCGRRQARSAGKNPVSQKARARAAVQMDDLVATFSTLARVEEMRAARSAKQVRQVDPAQLQLNKAGWCCRAGASTWQMA